MLKLTVACNNHQVDKNKKTLISSWGLSVYIDTGDTGILFDTGSSPIHLKNNFSALGIDKKRISNVVISHCHWDHTGGLDFALSGKDKKCGLFIPGKARGCNIKEGKYKVDIRMANEAVVIAPGIHSIGTTGMRIREQALALETKDGIVLLVGCAHPGILHMIDLARKRIGKDIYGVFGGFHLEMHPSFIIELVIRRIKGMGIKNIGPAHCTGENARKLFRHHFGKGYIDFGLGQVIQLN